MTCHVERIYLHKLPVGYSFQFHTLHYFSTIISVFCKSFGGFTTDLGYNETIAGIRKYYQNNNAKVQLPLYIDKHKVKCTQLFLWFLNIYLYTKIPGY